MKILKFFSILLIAFGVITFFAPKTNVVAGGCYLVYDYGSKDNPKPCNTFNPYYNPRNESPQNQWTRLCEGTEGCETWWWGGGGFCFGTWYDIECDAGNAGDTVGCECGNLVTCPGASCSTNINTTCTDSTHTKVSWSTNTQYMNIDRVELLVDTNNDGSLDSTVNLGNNASGSYNYTMNPGQAYRYRIDVYRSNAGGGRTCQSETVSRTCSSPNPAPNCSRMRVDKPNPTKGEQVTATATVTDTNNNLSLVAFYYGIASNNLCPSRNPIFGSVKKNGNDFSIAFSTASIPPGNYTVWAVPVDTLDAKCTGNQLCETTIGACSDCKASFTIQPDCTNITMSATSSCNELSLSSSISKSTRYNDIVDSFDKSEDFIEPCTWANGKLNGTCKIKQTGSFKWTRSWTETIDGASRSCNKALTVNTSKITLSCGAFNGSWPTNFTWGEQTDITLNYSTVPGQTIDANSVSNTVESGLNCTIPIVAGNNRTFSCTSTTFTPKLTHKWTEQNDCGFKLPCSTTFDKSTTTPPVGFFVTTKGNYFSGLGVTQSAFPKSGKSLAGYVFSSNKINSSDPFNSCSSNGLLCSEKDKSITENYPDKNIVSPKTWYEQIAGSVRGLPITNYQLGNYTLPITQCASRTIYLIEGSLTINKDFTIIDKKNHACIFIVNGKTTIAKDVENVEAFIITTDFTTASGTSPFLLKGGLITTGSTQLLRNINTESKVFPNDPSETFEYEGARYLHLFKEFFSESLNLQIRETQYNPSGSD